MNSRKKKHFHEPTDTIQEISNKTHMSVKEVKLDNDKGIGLSKELP